MKRPDRIGWSAFRSVKIRPTKLTTPANRTTKNGADVQPKFCAKAGMHSSKLKKIRMRIAPDISKFCGIFRTDSSLREVRTQAARMPAQMATQTHSIALQLYAETIRPPKVGPMITDAEDRSIYMANPFATRSWGNSVAI